MPKTRIEELAENWVKLHATPEELERLAEYSEENTAFESQAFCAFSAAEIMGAYVAYGITGGSRSEGQEFWINAGFDRIPRDRQTRQFAEAALAAAEL